jgi:hypothetical protein
MHLHITKIAFGSTGAADLRQRLEARLTVNGGIGEVRLTTRYLPKRVEEMTGGSLYWIHAHMIIGRSPILGFMENGEGRYWIRLEPVLIPVRSKPKRAHQGWRYLADADALADLDGTEADDREEMPAAMLGNLTKMGLV